MGTSRKDVWSLKIYHKFQDVFGCLGTSQFLVPVRDLIRKKCHHNPNGLVFIAHLRRTIQILMDFYTGKTICYLYVIYITILTGNYKQFFPKCRCFFGRFRNACSSFGGQHFFAHVLVVLFMQSFSAQTQQSWVGRTSTSTVEVSRWMRPSEMKSLETNKTWIVSNTYSPEN